MTCEEAVEDPFRQRYFQTHLDAIAKSITEDGSVISGYFAWSLMDNLGEWTLTVSLESFLIFCLFFSSCFSLLMNLTYLLQNGPMGTGLGSA